jgi:hypothetical protein
MLNNNLNYRAFWEAGYRVFGLHMIKQDGSCGCGSKDCKATGKHPQTSSWQHTPKWSDEQLEVMEETGQFETGYGVLCRGLLVIDVDARNDGISSYEGLVSKIPAIAGAGLIVETGSGGGSRHLYFKCPENADLIQTHPDYRGIDFKSSGFVVGPSSKHVSGNIYRIIHGSPADIDEAPQDLLHFLTKTNGRDESFSGRSGGLSLKDIEDMMNFIVNGDCDYEKWLAIGMALHHASHGKAYHIWRNWSAVSPKHDERHMPKKWRSFGKSAKPLTLGTLIYYAEKGGWQRPVNFEPDREYSEPKKDRNNNHTENDGVQLVRGDEIDPEPIDWLWKDFLARRKLQIIAGGAGTGKTTIAVNFAAIVTSASEWPDGTKADAGNVVVWSGEDGIADTLLPRFLAAGANPKRVFFVDVIKDQKGSRPFDPAKDMKSLQETIQRIGGTDLIIIDPIVSAISGDSHKNAETRRGLQPVVDLASSVGSALIGITHLSKGTKGASALERVTGSLAFGAVSRIVFLTIKKALPDEQAEDEGGFSLLKDDKPIAAFIRAKTNIGKVGGGFEYELQPYTITQPKLIETSRVHWRKKLVGNPEWLMSEYESMLGPSDKAVDKAKAFLLRLLTQGPIWVKDIEKYGAQSNISFASLKRAKDESKRKIVTSKQPDGRWFWSLSENAEQQTSEE